MRKPLKPSFGGGKAFVAGAVAMIFVNLFLSAFVSVALRLTVGFGRPEKIKILTVAVPSWDCAIARYGIRQKTVQVASQMNSENLRWLKMS